MNKKSVLLGIIIVLVTCLTTGCIFYNYLEPKDFKEQFSARGYTVEKIDKADYEADYISKATKEDVPYEVLYYQFATESDAKKAYKEYKSNLSNIITSDSKDVESKSSVLSKYVCKSDKEYIIISRVKNSLIYISTTVEYENEINDILTDIKY